MKKIILLKGLPASGKSTWAKEQCKQDGNIIRVNKDDIRVMLGGVFSNQKESIVLTIRDTLIKESILKNKTIIVDDTNLHTKHQDRIKEIAKELNAQLEIKEFFDITVDECIERDSLRQNPIGKKVIMDMYKKFIQVIPKIECNFKLSNCIIVDIDGTLAHMTNRSPYDESKVSEDTIDETIKDIVNSVKTKVILVSGRHDTCKVDTMNWLNTHGIIWGELHMRKADDNRPDYIVKKEIYNEYIKDKYNVLYVLDDRDQVVRMWREQGLKCLQVAEGNF